MERIALFSFFFWLSVLEEEEIYNTKREKRINILCVYGMI